MRPHLSYLRDTLPALALPRLSVWALTSHHFRPFNQEIEFGWGEVPVKKWGKGRRSSIFNF